MGRDRKEKTFAVFNEPNNNTNRKKSVYIFTELHRTRMHAKEIYARKNSEFFFAIFHSSEPGAAAYRETDHRARNSRSEIVGTHTGISCPIRVGENSVSRYNRFSYGLFGRN